MDASHAFNAAVAPNTMMTALLPADVINIVRQRVHGPRIAVFYLHKASSSVDSTVRAAVLDMTSAPAWQTFDIFDRNKRFYGATLRDNRFTLLRSRGEKLQLYGFDPITGILSDERDTQLPVAVDGLYHAGSTLYTYGNVGGYASSVAERLSQTDCGLVPFDENGQINNICFVCRRAGACSFQRDRIAVVEVGALPGETGSRVHILQPEPQQATQLANTRVGVTTTRVVADPSTANALLVVGGTTTTCSFDAVDRIDTRSKSLVALANVPVPYWNYAVCPLDDTSAVLFGETRNYDPPTDPLVYDTRADRWRTEPPWKLPDAGVFSVYEAFATTC